MTTTTNVPGPASQQPVISVDAVAFLMAGGSLRIVVAPRPYEPYRGQLALPGVMLLPRETVEGAANRALDTKAHPDTTASITWAQQGRYCDAANRDPRGASISLTRIIALGPNHPAQLEELSLPAIDLGKGDTTTPGSRAWVELPFGHAGIARAARVDLSRSLLEDARLVPALLGDSFSTAQVGSLLEDAGVPEQRANLARTLGTMFKGTGTTVPSRRGKPSRLWSAS